MSGGQAVKAGRGERGIPRPARSDSSAVALAKAEAEEGRGMPRVRPVRGRLDGQGAAGPETKKEATSAAGCPTHLARGIVTEWRRRRNGGSGSEASRA